MFKVLYISYVISVKVLSFDGEIALIANEDKNNPFVRGLNGHEERKELDMALKWEVGRIERVDE